MLFLATLNVIHFEDFVAVVVDYFDGDLAGVGAVEGAAGGAVEAAPGGFVDFGAEGALEFFVRLIGAGEVGMANEEAFAIVVGVDEPAGNVVSR